jgi:hypothetical protein
VQTAHILVQGLQKRKTKQVRLLDMCSEVTAPEAVSTNIANTSDTLGTPIGQQGYPLSAEVDWFQFVGGSNIIAPEVYIDSFDFP